MTWTQITTLVAAIIAGAGSILVAVTIQSGNIQSNIQSQIEAADRRAVTFLTEAAADRREMQSKMDAFRAEAAADRREMQSKMDAFRAEAAADRREIRKLAERQARIEGAWTTATAP